MDLTLETLYSELMIDGMLIVDDSYDGSYDTTSPVTVTSYDAVLILPKEDTEAEDQ